MSERRLFSTRHPLEWTMDDPELRDLEVSDIFQALEGQEEFRGEPLPKEGPIPKPVPGPLLLSDEQLAAIPPHPTTPQT